MQAVLLKITARRTKSGFETIRQEVVGECREGGGQAPGPAGSDTG